MRNPFLLILAAASLTISAFAQTIIQSNQSAPAALSIANHSLVAGQTPAATVTLTATTTPPNPLDVTWMCNSSDLGQWLSDNAAVATVGLNTGLVTAVAAGTAHVTCSITSPPPPAAGTTITGTSTITVLGAPQITNPTCGTPPCLLSVTNNVAYSNQFTELGGVAPFTWDCNGACSLPSGLSLTSGGLLSGTTTTNGTTNFTVRVRDNTSAQATVSVSLVVSGAVYGPPNYNAASTSTTNPGTITSPFTSTITGGNAATCSGDCQNSHKEDTTIPGHIAGTECITRISDGTTIPSGKGIGNLTISAGDNDHMISINGTYLWYAINGGTVNLAHLTKVAGCLQVVNTGLAFNVVPGAAFSTSSTVDTRYYYFTTGAQNKSMLTQGDLTSDTTATTTNLFDFMATGSCPGITPLTANWHSILGVSNDDDVFTISLATGAQGTADWIFQWSRTHGCRSANYKTGQYWAYCASSCGPSTPATGTFGTAAGTCWGTDGSSPGHGIHDLLASGDGTYLDVADTQGFTQGGSDCANKGANGPSIGSIALGLTEWCDNRSGATNLGCGAHESLGVSKMLTPGTGNSTLGPIIRPLNSLATITQFEPNIYTTQLITDIHGSWPHNNGGVFDDSLPWISTSSDVKTTAGSGCSSAVYCPNYLNNVIFAMFPGATYPPGTIKVFAHTYECGNGSSNAQCTGGLSDGADASIGVVSPKGDFFCWETGMLQQIATDNAGKPRKDAFCIMLQ